MVGFRSGNHLIIGCAMVLALAGCQSQIRIEPTGIAQSPVKAADAVPLSKDRITADNVLHLRDQMTQNELAKQALEMRLASYQRQGFNEVPSDDKRMRRLEQIFEKVHLRTHLAKMDLRPVLIERDVFQAYTLGGLEIVFYTGLTDSLSDDGLAIIIGHEIAHIAAGHAVEQVSRDVVNLSEIATDEARLSGFYAIEAEYEADRIGLLYATLAGYDASKAAEIWETLGKIGHRQKFNLFTATHPPDEKRDIRLEETAKQIDHLHNSDDWRGDLRCNPLYCADN